LVVMHRFPQEKIYDHMAETGTLPLEAMGPLTGAICELHSGALRRLNPDRPVAALMRVLEENEEAMAARPDFYEPERARDLAAMSREKARRLVALMRYRARGGWVRHCHGDLHLKNIVEIDGAPVLFDAIEFDDNVATVDVLYDLAFLLMDLWRRNMKRHANRVLNGYVDCTSGTGTLAGLATLPLFLSMRAMIRSKVEVLHSHGADGARELALHYFALAQEMIRPALPILVAIGGLSGTGKTTVARDVAADIGPVPGAVILRSDVERKKLFGIPETERLGPEGYTSGITETVYTILRKKAAQALAARHSVIVDAVHARQEERAELEELARRLGCKFSGMWLDGPVETLVERVTARRGDASDADADVVRGQQGNVTGEITWKRIHAGGDRSASAKAARALLVAR
ncbi:MAG: AAA family ATPase, partial [Pseudomonadota bacterium]|nr:AAA family ATPase [Pseudomonadota bacterium]